MPTNPLFQIKVNGNAYKGVIFLRLHKKRNSTDMIEFKIVGLVDRTDFAYQKSVEFLERDAADTMQTKFYGLIRKADFSTARQVYVLAYDESTKLYDRTWSVNATTRERKQWDNIAANTIVNESCSVNEDGSAPWILQPSTNTITRPITLRSEYDSKLKTVASVANMTDGEWWISRIGGASYFNIAALKETTTPVLTATAGQNAKMTKDSQDAEIIYNKVNVLGRGDGINQVQGTMYSATTNKTTLSTACTATDTTITVASTSLFAASGTIQIAGEKITYTGKGATTFTGCTRGTSSTKAYAHGAGLWVLDAQYTVAVSQAGSSIDTYGIREYTYQDMSIARRITGDPDEMAYFAAQAILSRYDGTLRTFEIALQNPTIGSLDVGKWITLYDSKLSINAAYKIYELIYLFSMDAGSFARSLSLVVNNQPAVPDQEVVGLKKKIDDSNFYGQGATNIYQVNTAENCDSVVPLYLRFYLPPDAVAVNRLKLNFKLKNYRAYSSTSNSSPSEDVDVCGISLDTETDNVARAITSSIPVTSGTATFQYHRYQADLLNRSDTTHTYDIAFKIDGTSTAFSDSQVLPDSNGYYWLYDDVTERDGHVVQTYFSKMWQNDELFTKVQTFYAHSHGLAFAISEEVLATPSVVVTVGTDGSETVAVGTYAADQQDIDLTDLIAWVPGTWYSIKFVANKRMRIEANLYIQIYLESK